MNISLSVNFSDIFQICFGGEVSRGKEVFAIICYINFSFFKGRNVGMWICV